MTELVYQRAAYRPGGIVARIVNLIVGIVELLLSLRIVLELLGANPSSAFIAWVYAATAQLVGPFTGAFSNIFIADGSFIDVSAILAMIVYAIIGWLVARLVSFVFSSVEGVG